jgi:DNA-binding MurR/RpiR family transcriptional regulator
LDSGTLEKRIRQAADTLSPQMRRAADYVARHPDEIASRSLRFVARTSSVAPPTLSRLARVLGFETYEGLRDSCRDEMRLRTLSFAERAQVLQDETRGNAQQPSLLSRQIASVIDNINAIQRPTIESELEQAAETLLKANRVLLYGCLAAKAHMAYLAYMARMALPNWDIWEDDATSTGERLATLDGEDVVVVMSVAPYAARAVQVARLARGQNATVLAITDSPVSPIARLSNQSLTTAADSPNFFVSYTATVLLLETLIGMIVARAGMPARKRIAAVQAANCAAGEYWLDETEETGT